MEREGIVYGMPRSVDTFWSRVSKGSGCWEYNGSRGSNGYGTCKVVGGYDYAHRISYRYAHGSIPDGLDLDHLCRNRACVRPDHLEPVSRKENARRGAMTLDFTGRCISERHPIESDEDLKMTSKGRTCRHCYNDAQARHYADIRNAALKLGIPITQFIRTYGKSAKKAREVLSG